MTAQQTRAELPVTTDDAPAGPFWTGSSLPVQLWVLTLRQLRLVFADRRVVLFGIAQPLIMLMLFSQIFGSLANRADLPGGATYIDFLLPAMLVTTGIGVAQGAGVGLLRDMEGGMVRRFRVLPLSLPLALVARSLADLLRACIQMSALVVGGTLLFGFGLTGGVTGLLGAALLSLVVIWSLIWVFIALATWVRKIEVLSSIGFFVSFPLMFASSAFVPVEVLPGWLGVVAKVNPVTYAVQASRHLALDWDNGGSVASALVAGLCLTAVMAVLSARAFMRPAEN